MQGKDDVTVVTDPWAALEGAHAVAILTEWDEFKTLDWQKALDVMQRPGAPSRFGSPVLALAACRGGVFVSVVPQWCCSCGVQI